MVEVEAAVPGEGEQSPLPWWQTEAYANDEDELFALGNIISSSSWTHSLSPEEWVTIRQRVEELQRNKRKTKFFYQIGRNPVPIETDRPAIVDLVHEDLQKRKEFGIAKYGVALQAHNGRNPLLDAYEEALDLVLYLRQCLEEQAG